MRFGRSGTWRAILLACGMALICHQTELVAGTVQTTGSVDRPGQSDEPFGVFAEKVTTGALIEKWFKMEREIENDRITLKRCQENRFSCESQALQFLAIVDSARPLVGRARLGEINRSINLSIKPMSDLALYGVEDVWSPPLVTFAKGAGDCEDYAIAKFLALQEAGVSPDDLRIVILRDDSWDEDHAVVAARLDGIWIMLDNRHMVMPTDQQVRDYYQPIFVIGRDSVKFYFAPSLKERQDLRAVGQIPH